MFIHFWLLIPMPQTKVSQFSRNSLMSHLPSILPTVADTYFWLVVVWKLIGLWLFKAMVYFFLCCSIFAQTMVSHFPRASRLLKFPSKLPFVVDAYFWLVVVWAVFDQGHPKAMVYYISIFHYHVNSCPKWWDDALPKALPPTRAFSQTSLIPLPPTIGWLLCVATKWRPLKADTPCFSLFLMRLFLATQISKPAIAPPNSATGALRRTIGSRGAIGWGHPRCTHGR